MPGLRLAVAAGKVDSHRIAEHMIQRLLDRDVRTAATDGADQFDLVMQVSGVGGVGDGRAALHDGVGGLGEEERRLAAGAAHLAGVGGVVASDAEDATHGEAVSGPVDGDGGRAGWIWD